jgi:hypothetical protein
MRAFILGAGASVHAGYPLATGLWSALESWARATYPAEHMFCSVVDEMNTRFDLSKSFELVLTDLDNRINILLNTTPIAPDDNFQKHLLLQLRNNMASMIPSYFNSLRSQPASLYDIFAGQVLASGDVVITFNYDLALDRALRRSNKWSIRDGYGFEVDIAALGSSPCKLFKLHGSTNWRGEVFRGMEGFSQMNWDERSLGQRPVIDSSELEYLGYLNASDPRCHRGRVRIESLIMPTANKQFFIETSLGREWQGFWNSLWAQAGEALQASDEVHLIGYSIPEYDDRARGLLGTMTNRAAKIEACCYTGTSSVVESLKGLGLVNARPASVTDFEGWVSNMKLP